VAAPRAIRIPRPAAGEEGSASPAASAVAAGAPLPRRQANAAGTQRAVRLTLVYLVFLGALYVGFLALARSTAGGPGLSAENGTLSFTILAAVLAIGGTMISLHPAPRYVETSSTATVVVGRWGRRHTYPPLAEIEAREVRRYAPGMLSGAPVLLVEVSGGPSPRATFLLEEGLIPTPPRRR